MKLFTAFCALIFLSGTGYAQCENWNNSPRKDEAEEAHVLYRQALKSKDYQTAFELWKTAFEIAPAADGHRTTHYTDGVEMYKHFYEKETDEAKKEEYKRKAIELYDQAITCMKEKKIVYKNCEDQTCMDQRLGKLMGHKAYDMFYTFLYPRAETYKVLKESVQLTGTAADYTVLYPYPAVVVGLFQTNQIGKEEARNAYVLLHQIADYGAENHPSYGDYYVQAKDAINSTYAIVEKKIFDCAYFVEKYKPDYEADPTNIDLLRDIIRTLKEGGCDSTEAFLVTVEDAYSEYASAYNDSIEQVFLQNNPAIAAKRAFDEGKYTKAIELYKDAIAKETDADKKATYYFAIASIQFRQLNQYSSARESARDAAKLRSGWGRPYMLIGDMYAKSSSSCGKDAYSRGLAVLAAIEKWAYAKSIDSEVAGEANKKIATYSEHIPPQDDAFMMGKSEGQKETAGCWIGETVTLRFN